VKASTIGTILCAAAVFVVWRFAGFSRSVFVVDWLLFTWLVIGSRMSFRLLAHWVQSLAGARFGRLLVVGTRDRSANVLRAIQQGVFGEYLAVGFVDVREDARDRRIVGVEVLGPVSRLGNILDGLKVDGVVIVLDGKSDFVSDIRGECSRRGVLCSHVELLEMPQGEDDAAGPESLQQFPGR